MSEIEIPDVTVFVLRDGAGLPLGVELDRERARAARDELLSVHVGVGWREFSTPLPGSVRRQVLESVVEDVAKELHHYGEIGGWRTWGEEDEEQRDFYRDEARRLLGLASEGEDR